MGVGDQASVERFVEAAREFTGWVVSGQSTGEGAAREALTLLLKLMLATIDLPKPGDLDPNDDPDLDGVSYEEWESVRASLGRLPFDAYNEVFDPFADPVEPPVVASLSDDIADIYREVDLGLRTLDAGYPEAAVWEWLFSFQTHWGEHATGTIRALHCWLASR